MTHEAVAQRPTEAEESHTKGWILVNPRILIGLIGVVACYGWLFLMLGTSAFFPLADPEGLVSGGAHLAFVGGACLGMAAVWYFSDALTAHRMTHFVISAVLTAAGLAGMWVLQGSSSLLWLPTLASGCGFGMLSPLYGEYVCLFFHGHLRVYVNGIFAAAALACAWLLFVSQAMIFAFSALFPVVALVCYLIVMNLFDLRERSRADRASSDGRQRIVWRSYLATATAGMAVGYAVGCILSTQTVHDWPYIIIELMVLATCSGLLYDAAKTHFVTESMTMRWFLPAAAMVVFPLIFVPEDLVVIFALLLLCGSFFPITCSLSAVCKHIVICDLSAVRAFSFGRLMSFLGIALGMVLAFAGFAPGSVAYFGPLVTAGSVICFMVLVIFSASFVMTEDNYPDERRFKRVEADGASSLSVAPGTPIRKIDTAAEAAAPAEPDAHRPSVFHLKCEAVANRYGLSSRQREVLTMLAKGRNAEYITEKLVISSHTAKAHIYNIYQKTGVHSRQELMDLVESAEIDDRPEA